MQYKALLAACDTLCEQKGLAADKLYVWLDYVSIPQVNPTLKQLAIESLAIYSSACSYFLVLAPDAVHSDTQLVCDQASYSRRGWCRLELWANATSGFSGMFVYGANGELEPRAAAGEALKDATFVFEGDFTVDKDKAKIVDTVLGLWSLVLSNKGDLLEQVNGAEAHTALDRPIGHRTQSPAPAA